MLRSIVALISCLALVACGVPPPNTAGQSVPPPVNILPGALTRTVIDDQAINFSFETFDTVLTFVDLGIASGRIVPGSLQALKIKAGLITTRNWLNAAKTAQEAGSTTSYTEAFAKAAAAFAQVKLALKGS